MKIQFTHNSAVRTLKKTPANFDMIYQGAMLEVSRPSILFSQFKKGQEKIGLCPRTSFLGSRYFSIGKSAQSLSKLTIGSKSCSRARKIFKGFLPLFPYFIFFLLCTTFERHKWTSSKVTYGQYVVPAQSMYQVTQLRIQNITEFQKPLDHFI